jgi:PAS domain S-box-containing protein
VRDLFYDTLLLYLTYFHSCGIKTPTLFMITVKRKSKYRSLFHRSIDPIFLALPDLVLIDVNESFLNLLEYTSIKETPVNLKCIFEQEKDFTQFQHALSEFGQVKNMEVALITKTGSRKICLINCVFISDDSPELGCYQGIIHDLTQRKQAEHDSLNAARLSLTGKIARTIAHELRNPLTNLKLALDQLHSELPNDNDSINQYSSIIERNINRIEQLVDEMLNSSKPKELRLKYTPVINIITDTMAMAHDRIMLNQITVRSDIQEDLPALLVDKPKIQLALLNIIINAIEAMTPGNGILNIGASLEKNTITIAINDNGRGVLTADLEKLFEPFFTLKHSGIGLGLTAAKSILTSHNAQIEVQSDLKNGTTFFIRFKL